MICMHVSEMSSHSQLRLSVCCSCQKPGCKRKLTPSLLGAARQFLYKDFDLTDLKLPIGICDSCRGKLSRNTDPKTAPTYSHWIADSVFGHDPCRCYICFFARSKKNLNGKPPEKPSKDSQVTICRTCFCQVTSGLHHECLLSNRVRNLLLLVPPDVVQQLASHVILEDSDRNNNSENDSIKLLREGGRHRLRVYLHKRKRKKRSKFQVSHIDLDKLKVKLKLSKTKSKVLAQGIRHVSGSRKAIAPGYKEHLVQQSRDQEPFLTVDHIQVKKTTKKSEEEVSKQVVHVKDLQQYFDYIRRRRNISPADCLLKLMGDTGKDYLERTEDLTR